MTDAEKDSACVPPWLPPQPPVSTKIYTDTQMHAHTQNVHTDTSRDTQDQPIDGLFLGPATRPTNSSKHFCKYFGSGDDAGHMASGILELTQDHL